MKKEIRLLGIPVYSVQETETRSETPSSSTAALPSWLLDMKGTSSASKESALSVSAYFRGISLLSSSVASLPIRVYERGADNRRAPARNHKVHRLLSRRPNTYMTSYVWRQLMLVNAIGEGNAYSIIIRDRNYEPIELLPVSPADVEVIFEEKTRSKVFRWRGYDGILGDEDVLHIVGLGFDGVKGKSLVKVMSRALGVSTSADQLAESFFENHANLGGYLKAPGKLDEAAYNRLRESWTSRYAGPSKSGSTAILEGGMEYQKLGITFQEGQFSEIRSFQVIDIARFLGIQPHLLFSNQRDSRANIEHQGIEFVTFTLQPWVVAFEQEINYKLFTETESQRYYAEFELNGLLRGDSSARGEYYQKLFSVGALSPNDINALENRDSFEGGDQRFVQGAYVPIDMIRDFYAQKLTNQNEKGNPAID